MSLALRRSHGVRWEQTQSSGQSLPLTHVRGKMLNGHLRSGSKPVALNKASLLVVLQIEQLNALTELKIRSECSIEATG